MTWNQLAKKITEMSNEEKESDIAAHIVSIDEFFPIIGIIKVYPDSQFSDILDPGNHYFEVDA